MRNKTTCTRLIDKLDSDFKKLLFILSRPDTSSNLRRFIEREQETM